MPGLTPAEVEEGMRAWRHVAEAAVSRYLGRSRVPPRLLDRGDLLGAALCGLWEALRSWDPARGAGLGSWARTVCTGRILDRVREITGRRRAGRVQRRGWSVEASVSLDAAPDDGDELAATAAAGGPDRWAQEAGALVEAALRGLTERERLAVRAVWLEGGQQAEVARLLGLSQSRVSQMLSRLMPRMREAIENHWRGQ